MDLTTLNDRIESFAADLRGIGIYADSVQTRPAPDGSTTLVMVDAFLGDVAFGQRVQDPVAHDFDTEFRKMTATADADQFLDVRAEWERRIQSGQLFDDRGQQ